MNDLDLRLLAAHSANDQQVLVSLYTQAAEAASDDIARGFYLTHAYVFALETDHPDAANLRARLKTMGRED